MAETRPTGDTATSGDVPEQELTSIAEHVALTLDVWEHGSHADPTHHR